MCVFMLFTVCCELELAVFHIHFISFRSTRRKHAYACDMRDICWSWTHGNEVAHIIWICVCVSVLNPCDKLFIVNFDDDASTLYLHVRCCRNIFSPINLFYCFFCVFLYSKSTIKTMPMVQRRLKTKQQRHVKTNCQMKTTHTRAQHTKKQPNSKIVCGLRPSCLFGYLNKIFSSSVVVSACDFFRQRFVC